MIKSTILLIGYNRPDLLKQRIRELINLKMHNLGVQVFIDGPKKNDSNSNLEQIIEMLDESKEEIDLSITLRKSNLGAANNVVNAITVVLEKQESVLVFEDDVSINAGSILSMDRVLQEMDSDKFATVGAFGAFPYSRSLENLGLNNHYRCTPYFSAWGWGIRRDVWSDYRLDIAKLDHNLELENSYIFKQLSKYQQNAWVKRFDRISTNVHWAWDYQMQYMSFVTNRLHILPILRQVNNVGFNDVRSTNTSGKRPRWYIFPNTQLGEGIIISKHIFNSRLMRFIDSITFIGDSRINRHRILRKLKLSHIVCHLHRRVQGR